MTKFVQFTDSPNREIQFPQECAVCGAPPSEAIEYRISRLFSSKASANRRRYVYVEAEFKVPFCAEHAQVQKSAQRANTVKSYGLLGALVIGAVVGAMATDARLTGALVGLLAGLPLFYLVLMILEKAFHIVVPLEPCKLIASTSATGSVERKMRETRFTFIFQSDSYAEKFAAANEGVRLVDVSSRRDPPAVGLD